LRERLKHGDPDMAADEIQAAIDRASEKRREIQEQQIAAPSARMFTMLPRAAEAYRRQITLGLDGDPRAALKARVILRDLFGGKIRLVPQLDGGLIAHWNLHPGALLKGLGGIW
jgi:site-specific DNA recombinase